MKRIFALALAVLAACTDAPVTESDGSGGSPFAPLAYRNQPPVIAHLDTIVPENRPDTYHVEITDDSDELEDLVVRCFNAIFPPDVTCRYLGAGLFELQRGRFNEAGETFNQLVTATDTEGAGSIAAWSLRVNHAPGLVKELPDTLMIIQDGYSRSFDLRPYFGDGDGDGLEIVRSRVREAFIYADHRDMTLEVTVPENHPPYWPARVDVHVSDGFDVVVEEVSILITDTNQPPVYVGPTTIVFPNPSPGMRLYTAPLAEDPEDDPLSFDMTGGVGLMVRGPFNDNWGEYFLLKWEDGEVTRALLDIEVSDGHNDVGVTVTVEAS